ncbi:MAG: hypothetical protein SCK29_12540 [Bacillota bacterium]|nr:hypothetical protein [Bacillota bacterium]MDW7684929.1 hypothetical protein [Bacillota bacterium]
MKSKEKKERCGGLSGDVAKFTIDMLNEHFEGAFAPTFMPTDDVGECKACHGKYTQGKDSCSVCHGGLNDPHPDGI